MIRLRRSTSNTFTLRSGTFSSPRNLAETNELLVEALKAIEGLEMQVSSLKNQVKSEKTSGADLCKALQSQK